MRLATLTKDRIKKDKPDGKKGKRNPVAQHVRTGLNKSVKMKDRKRASKRGKVKHKKQMFESLFGDNSIF